MVGGKREIFKKEGVRWKLQRDQVVHWVHGM